VALFHLVGHSHLPDGKQCGHTGTLSWSYKMHLVNLSHASRTRHLPVAIGNPNPCMVTLTVC
jgi:hypothetical protein